MRIGLLVALIACSGKPSEDAAPPEPVPTSKPAPPAPTKKPPEKVTSPLPEKGPHPDYPTPVAAGTDKIFLIEEPDRGPLPPLDFPYPASTDGTPYAHCDDGTMMPICAGTAV